MLFSVFEENSSLKIILVKNQLVCEARPDAMAKDFLFKFDIYKRINWEQWLIVLLYFDTTNGAVVCEMGKFCKGVNPC